MNAKGVAERIGEYLKESVDVDRLDGPYAVKGMFMDQVPSERLEVGKTFETGYRPVIQIELEPEPRIEKRKNSYIDSDNFSGSAFQPEFA